MWLLLLLLNLALPHDWLLFTRPSELHRVLPCPFPYLHSPACPLLCAWLQWPQRWHYVIRFRVLHMHSGPVAVIIFTQCQVAVSELQARFIASLHRSRSRSNTRVSYGILMETEFPAGDSLISKCCMWSEIAWSWIQLRELQENCL